VEVNMVLPADTWALLKRAAQGVRLSADGPMSDAETVGAVVMEALNSLTSAGKGAHAADPRKAVVLYHCVDCSRTELETNAGAVPLSPAAAERLGCGAKVVDLDTEGWGESFGGEIPAPVRRAVLARDRGRCRCCGRRRYVEVHHLTPRSDGGAHSRAGCASLCSACHAAVHEGKLRVEGDAESGLVFFDDRGNELADHFAGGSAAAKGAKPSTSEAPAATPGMSEEAAAVLAAMGRRGGWHADHLADATQLPFRAVNRALLELQLRGLAHQDYLFRWLPAGGSLFGIAVEDDEPAQSDASEDAPIGTSSTAAGPVTTTELAARAVSEEAATVLAAMSGRGGWHADHLTDATKLPFRVVNRALLELQLAGLVGQDYRFLWVPAGT
jgi:hypothetical protein